MTYKIIIILFAILSLKAYAYSSFYYNQEKINLDSTMMDRYVRPQLIAMVEEYYQTLSALHPLNAHLIKIKTLSYKAYSSWLEWNNTCNKITPQCLDNLTSVKKVQKELDVTITKAQKQAFDQSFFHNQAFTDTLFLLSSELDELSMLNYLTMDTIDLTQILSLDSMSPARAPADLVGQNIKIIQLKSEKMLTHLLNKSLQHQYSDLWFFFIKDLEGYLYHNKPDSFFLGKLETFNQNWNHFHMLLSKSIVKAPPEIIKTLLIMHNRWNSVLRIILKSNTN